MQSRWRNETLEGKDYSKGDIMGFRDYFSSLTNGFGFCYTVITLSPQGEEESLSMVTLTLVSHYARLFAVWWWCAVCMRMRVFSGSAKHKQL